MVPRRKGQNLRLYLTVVAKMRSLELASQTSYLDAESEPASHLKLNAVLEVRVSQASLQ